MSENNLNADFINFLIKKFNFKSYLEIGVFNGHTFNNVQCEQKHGIDPVGGSANLVYGGKQMTDSAGANILIPYNPAQYQFTSDEFFTFLNPEKKYDIIYVDGDHRVEFVDRDIENSLKHVSENGIIIVDDISPPFGTELTLQPWMSWIKLRCNRNDLSMASVKTGGPSWTQWPAMGIIKFGKQETLDKSRMQEFLEVDCFNKNRNKILNILSHDDINGFLEG